MGNKKISNQTDEPAPTFRDVIPVGHTTDGVVFTPEKVTHQNLMKLRVVSKTAAYPMADNDDMVIADATSAAFSVTLPTAVGKTGVRKTVKRINSAANNVTVDTTGGQTIDGAATSVLTTQHAKVTVISDGTNWLTV